MSRERPARAASRRDRDRAADRVEDGADAGRFVRGLTIGLLVGAVIAGSTLWRRFGPLRTRP